MFALASQLNSQRPSYLLACSSSVLSDLQTSFVFNAMVSFVDKRKCVVFKENSIWWTKTWNTDQVFVGFFLFCFVFLKKDFLKKLREAGNCCHEASVQVLPVSEELLEVSFSPSGALFPEAWLILSGKKVKGRDKEKRGESCTWEGRPMYVPTLKMLAWK